MNVLQVITLMAVEPQTNWDVTKGLDLYNKATKFFHKMRVEENREPHPHFNKLKSKSSDWFYHTFVKEKMRR